MAYEQKDNSCTLFVNDKREKDTHPTHKGDAKIDGKLYWASAWEKQTKNGSQMFSIAFKEKDAVTAAGIQKTKAAIAPKAEEKPFYDEEVPF